MPSSDSIHGLLDSKLCSIELKTGLNLFYLRLVVLINTLCSESTFTSVNLRAWGGDGDICCGDRVGTGTSAGRMSGDGFCVDGDGRGWGSVSVPVQSSMSNNVEMSFNIHVVLPSGD